MKRVVIESPYGNENLKNVKLNEVYGELAMHDCLVNYNEAPYASHLLYTRAHVLRDEIPSDRKLGIDAGFEWRDVAEKSVFYNDLGITKGMDLGITDCIKKNKPYELRRLPDDLWNIFICYALENGHGVIKREEKKEVA
jgi:hypothetical protein